MAVTFIRIEKSLESAMSVFESPVSRVFEYRGVQLLPGSAYPYVQTTSSLEGIELEDWEVKVFSLCGRELGDITEYFFVDRVFDDAGGIPQIDWSIRNCPMDFGWQLVYLMISQVAGEDFYTSPFQMTAIESQFTARFDYRDNEYQTMQSVQLQTHFRAKLPQDELTTYYETSTGNTVTKALKQVTYQKWVAGLFSNDLAIMFRNMLNLKETYCNLKWCNLFEAMEIPEPSSQENFSEIVFKLAVDGNKLYDPNYVAPVVPPSDLIGVRVKAYNMNGLYYLIFMSERPQSSTASMIEGNSFVSFNGGTGGFNMNSYIAGVEEILDFSVRTHTKTFSPVPNQINLDFFGIRFLTDEGYTNYSYQGPQVIFTQSDIENGIIKTLQAEVENT